MLQFEYYYKNPIFTKRQKGQKDKMSFICTFLQNNLEVQKIILANCDHIENDEIIISQSDIEKMIVTIRGEQVLIDRDFDEFLSFCTFCNFGLYEYSRNE